MIKGVSIEVSDDLKVLIDNWTLLDRDLINDEILYYNVPIEGAYVSDALGHKQSISVGDLINLKPVFTEILLLNSDNSYIFYALKTFPNDHNKGIICATDLSLNQYVFPIDNIQETYSMLHQNMGIEGFEEKYKLLRLTPSCATVTDLIDSLKKGEYLPEYIVNKFANTNPKPHSQKQMLIPCSSGGYLVKQLRSADFKKIQKEMQSHKGV